MEFTAVDQDSMLWQKLTAHYRDRLASLRTLNDTPMEESQRNRLLGQIHEVKLLLAFGQPHITIPSMME